jgi:hypothetical protein
VVDVEVVVMVQGLGRRWRGVDKRMVLACCLQSAPFVNFTTLSFPASDHQSFLTKGSLLLISRTSIHDAHRPQDQQFRPRRQMA